MFSTLASRLTAWLVSLLILFSLVAASSVGSTVKREMNEAMDATLQQVARRLMPALVENVYSRPAQTQAIVLPDSIADEDEPLAFQLRDASGRVLLRSGSAPADVLAPTFETGFVSVAGRRVYTEAAVSNTFFVQVSEDEDVRSEEIWEATKGLLVPLAVLGPLVALSIWLVVWQLTRPVAALQAAIGERHGSYLEPLDPSRMPEELASITHSVNALMSRLRHVLEAEREFSANAAHELRTPLAGAIAQIDLLARETGDNAARTRATDVKNTLQNLSRLSDRLLQLARADAQRDTSNSVTDLGAAAWLFAEQFQRSWPSREIEIKGLRHGPQVKFDTDSLGIILRNLLENAVRHSASGPISISIEEAGGLSVVNEAPIIDEARLADIQNRFERTRDLAEGSGLGLSIVSRLAGQGNAKLALRSFGGTDGVQRFEAVIGFRPA
jgi:two-component system OmpR family sensor kinase